MKPLHHLSVGIACDHAGYDLKQAIIKAFESKVMSIYDFGCYSTESCDYPDFAHALGHAIEAQSCDLGIAICGSANGISMTLNKHQKVRAAICWSEELAALARQHNDANVVSLPARFISENCAMTIVETFLTTNFEGGRHQKRVKKIALPTK